MQRNREPNLTEVLQSQDKATSARIRVAMPAKVLSFDGKHTVTAQIMIKQNVNGKHVSYPPIPDVPVSFLRAGGFSLTVPVKVGDEGTLLFYDRCIDGFYASGKESEILDFRLHDLSDASFLPGGITSLPNALGGVFTDGLSLQTDDGSTYLRVTKGKILIKGNLEIEGNTNQVGDTVQTGNIATQGMMSAVAGGSFAGVSVENHTHSGVESGDKNTGIPNK
ncbi:Gp138 family membrane-puncturing spike protein [Proteus mirabilis]|uniref:Gp138 family membrane-puncturing spike protein n=1 Tax=Proteus mirabilis TaxID=584 RepID=UPI003558429B